MPRPLFTTIRINSPSKGFTLLELIVVIIIIGILAVSVLPRFFTSQGYEEYAYRGEVISTLRATQLRAMQQNAAYCIGVNSKNLGVMWDGSGNRLTACPGAVSFPSNYGQNFDDTLEVAIESGHQVTFSIDGGSGLFAFDKLGRPNGDCTGGCIIAIAGSDNLTVAIESEGYIHAN